MSGINVWLQLQGCHDVVAEPFVLAPPGGMKQERKHRRKLLERRGYLLNLGLDEVCRAEDVREEARSQWTFGPSEDSRQLGRLRLGRQAAPITLSDLLLWPAQEAITQMAPELGMNNIKNPLPRRSPMGDRLVWAVPPHLVLRNTVEEVHDACAVSHNPCRARTQIEELSDTFLSVSSTNNAGVLQYS